ncbi:MAG: hypothetical protein RI933_874 [Actinomycetota bacterium]|jgi:ABC-type bacteriocin/lantibiotic exporter with double-glycine peptidase domain
MKNPWILYITIRVGLFAVILAVMLMLGFDPFFAALIAAVVSLAISLIFFNKQRNAVSEAIYRSVENRKKNVGDSDSDAEDSASKN